MRGPLSEGAKHAAMYHTSRGRSRYSHEPQVWSRVSGGSLVKGFLSYCHLDPEGTSHIHVGFSKTVLVVVPNISHTGESLTRIGTIWLFTDSSIKEQNPYKNIRIKSKRFQCQMNIAQIFYLL